MRGQYCSQYWRGGSGGRSDPEGHHVQSSGTLFFVYQCTAKETMNKKYNSDHKVHLKPKQEKIKI